MNTQLKILELVLAELIGERELKEMDINSIINSEDKNASDKKNIIRNTLSVLSNINNDISLLTDYIQQIQKQVNTQSGTPGTTDNTGIEENNNNPQ